MKRKKIDCLCIGSIIADYVLPDNAVQYEGKSPISIAGEGVRVRAGGIAIVAMGLSRLGLRTALAGMAGNDVAGHGLKNFLKVEFGIETEGIQLCGVPTSSSLVFPTRRERYIRHYIGANAGLDDIAGILAIARRLRPKLASIGYAGLLPRLDARGGAGMADLLKNLRALKVKCCVDAHTLRRGLKVVGHLLPHADIFFCNMDEGRQISAEKEPFRVLDGLLRKAGTAAEDRPRLMGITTAQGVYMAYMAGRGIQKDFVRSLWHTAKPVDLTGAGDAFRAGVHAHVLAHLREFEQGVFPWRSAGMLGNLTASVMVTKGVTAIQPYKIMLKRSAGS